MALALVLGSVALLAGRTGGVEVTEKTWKKEVTDRVENGQFVFAKFLAPW